VVQLSVAVRLCSITRDVLSRRLKCVAGTHSCTSSRLQAPQVTLLPVTLPRVCCPQKSQVLYSA
jgi:hypothetical protein